MKERMEAISEMYRQWRNIYDTIDRLRLMDYTCTATSLRWEVSVLEEDIKGCVEAMRRVAEIMEKEETNNDLR